MSPPSNYPSSPATVTLGVPGYRGEEFMAESLASIQAQTHADLQVLISLDGAQPGLEEECRPFLDDPRFRLVVQPERLGWVGNLNWLISQARTPFFCYQQQDDVLEPAYLETLVRAARQHPGAAVVYCDMQTFGSKDQPVVQPSVGGTSSGRQLALLYDHHAAVALRGLCRLGALQDAGRLRSNEVDDFASDTVWMSAMARAGDLERVPETLYRKRFHDGNEHTRWARWPDEQRVRAWVVHCAEMLDEAMLAEATVDERRLLLDATLHRLTTARCAPEYLPDSARTPGGRSQLLSDFYAYLRRSARPDLPDLMGSDWDGLRRTTRRWRRSWEPAGPEGSAEQAVRRDA